MSDSMRKASRGQLSIRIASVGAVVAVAIWKGHLDGISGFVLGVLVAVIVHDLAFGEHV